MTKREAKHVKVGDVLHREDFPVGHPHRTVQVRDIQTTDRDPRVKVPLFNGCTYRLLGRGPVGGNAKRLTPYQQRIMLVLCDAAEHGRSARLIVDPYKRIRETTAGWALVSKGLARRVLGTNRFEATTEGFWLGDALRIADRQGKIPER